MPDWLYQAGGDSPWVFVFITVLIGGAAAWVSGKSLAQTWRPLWQVPAYILLLTCGVRFLHYALFQEPLLAIQNWVVDYSVLLVLALLGFRRMRALQVSTQYFWLFEASTPFGWRRKSVPSAGTH
jgi:Domain of unknown function (DUF6867)